AAHGTASNGARAGALTGELGARSPLPLVVSVTGPPPRPRGVVRRRRGRRARWPGGRAGGQCRGWGGGRARGAGDQQAALEAGSQAGQGQAGQQAVVDQAAADLGRVGGQANGELLDERLGTQGTADPVDLGYPGGGGCGS